MTSSAPRVTFLVCGALLLACGEPAVETPAPVPAAAPGAPEPEPEPETPEQARARAETLVAQGLAAEAEGRYSAALIHLSDATTADPEVPLAWTARGRVLIKDRRTGWAEECLTTAERVDGPGEASFLLGDVHVHYRRHQAAIDAFGRALDAGYRNADSHARIAIAYAGLGDREEASRHLATARELDPDAAYADLEPVPEPTGMDAVDLSAVKASLAEIRELAFEQPVGSATRSVQDFGAMVERGLEQAFPRGERDDVLAGLRKLGMLDRDVDLAEAMTGALMSQAAAYYDPDENTFFMLAENMPTELVEMIAAHELVHALQDQHLGLDGLMAAAESEDDGGVRNDDRVLAIRCLAEGDATFTQSIYQVCEQMGIEAEQAATIATMGVRMMSAMAPEQMFAMMRASAQAHGHGESVSAALAATEDIPHYILVPLYTAYISGAGFVGAIHMDGGWEAVDAIYEDPPSSTEQCLHPEKYLHVRDEPSSVRFTDDVPHGWREVDRAIHGELYVRLLLTQNGVPHGVAVKAAAGWDGDLYVAWRDDDDRTAFELATVWDTDEDAAGFRDAYLQAVQSKYGAAPGTSDAQDGAASISRYDTDVPGAVGVVRLAGREVVIVEGLSDDDEISKRLLGAEVEFRD